MLMPQLSAAAPGEQQSIRRAFTALRVLAATIRKIVAPLTEAAKNHSRRDGLVRWRIAAALTQEQLAETVGVSVGQVRRWESGRTKTPRPEMLRGLAIALSKTVAAVAHEFGLIDEQTAPSAGALAEERFSRRRFLVGAAAIPAGLWAAPQLVIPSMVNLPAAGAILDGLESGWHGQVRVDNQLGPAQAVDHVLAQLRRVAAALPHLSGRDAQEALRWQARYAESAAWLHEDLGVGSEANRWSLVARESARRAEFGLLEAWTMVGTARHAVLQRDPQLAIQASDWVLNAALPIPESIRAAALGYKAEALALQGDNKVALRTLERADQHAQHVEGDPEGDATAGYASWCTPGYIAAQRGRCLHLGGRAARAVEQYAASLSSTPDLYVRDRAWVLARLAGAYADGGEVEQASAAAAEAYSLGLALGSRRCVNEAARVANRLYHLGYTPEWFFTEDPTV